MVSNVAHEAARPIKSADRTAHETQQVYISLPFLVLTQGAFQKTIALSAERLER